MHVAFALLTLFPGRVGGSESNVRGLLREFAAGNGPERVSLLANARVAAAYGHFAAGPVAVHPVTRYRAGDSDATRLLAMITAGPLKSLLAAAMPAGIDVLHHPVTVPVPSLTGVPTVTTVYDLQHHDLPRFFSRGERAFRRWAYDGAARRADLVLTTSEFSRTRLIDLVGVAPDRVEAVHMGIDHERFTCAPQDADDRLAVRLSLPERFLVYPANLWPHKNHDRLIDALAAARDREIALVLTGQDLGRADTLHQRARRSGLGDRVRHVGYLQPVEVPSLLRKATAMIFPSLYEGFGSPPLEAMACGCPAACSLAGSLPEVVGDGALTFDPMSVEAIADAIDRISGDASLRATLRAKGLTRASEFSWSAAAARHRSLYERAAATSPSEARSR